MLLKDGDVQYTINVVPMQYWSQLQEQGTKFYDYTMLSAVNTCPTWGVLRYGLHRTDLPLSMGGRNLAIECGSACHDFFAALRAWTLPNEIRHSSIGPTPSIRDEWITYHFGDERAASMLQVPQDSDHVNNAQLFALDALHTSGYYDDPKDTRRTMSNMESSCLVYADRYFKSDLPVYAHDDLIGIEVPFVLFVMRTRHAKNHTHSEWMHYCGRIDGIHTLGTNGPVCIGENKTAARLSDTWRMSFSISHQVTGYMVAAECITGHEVNNAIVMGLQIPLPRDIFDGVSFELCTRTESDKIRWCEWLFDSRSVYDQYMHDPVRAPRYSHSCNRFFSACQFIPYCALERSEQQEALTYMRVDEWSPLKQVHHSEGVSE